MKKIYVEKVTLNIGTGKPGDELEKAVKLLKAMSNHLPVKTEAKKRIPTWGLRPGLQIGTKVTLRDKEAEELLRRLLQAKKNELKRSNFDDNGNLSFGIHEYLDIPGVKYDPSIGIIGLEVAITLSRPGYSIKLRRVKKRNVGARHKIKKEDAIDFMVKNYGVNIKVEE